MPIDMDLHQALHQFRKDCMSTKYGAAMLKDLGPSLILSNEILQRIIDAAHAGRIATVGDIKREVKWSRVDEFGEDVVRIVLAHPTPLPAPPRTSTPVRARLKEVTHPLFALAPAPLRLATSETIRTTVDTNLSLGATPSLATNKSKRVYTCGICGIQGHTGS